MVFNNRNLSHKTLKDGALKPILSLKLKLQHPVAPGPQDIPHQSLARPEPAGVFFQELDTVSSF